MKTTAFLGVVALSISLIVAHATEPAGAKATEPKPVDTALGDVNWLQNLPARPADTSGDTGALKQLAADMTANTATFDGLEAFERRINQLSARKGAVGRDDLLNLRLVLLEAFARRAAKAREEMTDLDKRLGPYVKAGAGTRLPAELRDAYQQKQYLLAEIGGLPGFEKSVRMDMAFQIKNSFQKEDRDHVLAIIRQYKNVPSTLGDEVFPVSGKEALP